ncbi:hypothetical protein U1Q18_006516 [Sarracenia purpurea var. burkii]
MQSRTDPTKWTLQKKPKRKVLDFATNQAGVKKDRKVSYVNGVDERTDTVDRISELPEPIIHHILSFLRCPKDVARACVLSKRWRSIWSSFLTFDFDQKSFKAQGGVLAEFNRFVESSLSTRIAPLICIQKFRLHITSFDSGLAHHMDRWLCAATTKNVKELEIYVQIEKYYRRCYTLPRIVLAAETLTSLKLHGCKLDNYNDLNLPNLRQLSIKKVYINLNIIQSFIRSCPWIEDLRLIQCTGLVYLHVSTLINLDRVEVHECQGLKQIQIEIPNLQTFWCCVDRSVPCNINLECCTRLKSLTLTDTKMTDELFKDQISKFPVLEKLVLKECRALKRITILSQKLKRLALIRCKNLLGAIVDAPNLHSFEYTGDKIFCFSMETPKLQEAKLYFESMRKDGFEYSGEDFILWLSKFQEFLGKFRQSKNLKVVVRNNKGVLVFEELRDMRLVPENDLKFEIISSSTNLEDILGSMLRTTHPETISVISPASGEVFKLLHDKLMNREENPSCCKYYSKKCWRHYLKDVKIGSKPTHPWMKMPSSGLHQTTTFRMEWTEG